MTLKSTCTKDIVTQSNNRSVSSSVWFTWTSTWCYRNTLKGLNWQSSSRKKRKTCKGFFTHLEFIQRLVTIPFHSFLYRTKIHRPLNNGRVTRSNEVGHREWKESVGIFPAEETKRLYLWTAPLRTSYACIITLVNRMSVCLRTTGTEWRESHLWSCLMSWFKASCRGVCSFSRGIVTLERSFIHWNLDQHSCYNHERKQTFLLVQLRTDWSSAPFSILISSFWIVTFLFLCHLNKIIYMFI